MSTSRHPRATKHSPAADEALARLLANAAPPRDYSRELRGEEAAIAAFRDARPRPASIQRRQRMSATKLFAVKAVIAAVGLSGGGVALAATTGHMPAQLGGKPAIAASGSPSPSAAAAKATARGSHPAASPSPSLRGLCHAYTAGAGSNPGKALDNPAFSALITAAGGKSNVGSYCVTLLAAAPSAHATAHPGGRPSALPTPSHPGKPTSVPTSGNGTGGGNSGSGSGSGSGGPTAPTGKPSLHP